MDRKLFLGLVLSIMSLAFYSHAHLTFNDESTESHDHDDHDHHDHGDGDGENSHVHDKRDLDDENIEDFHYHETSEHGEKLPFDSPFCDLNENGMIDDDEIKPDNFCLFEGLKNVLSPAPLAALGLNRGELLLTIDDGPNPTITRPILDLLDQYGIKATFFIVGNRISSNESLIKEMLSRGHTIGNHTYSHDVPNINSDTITKEVLQSHRALTKILGHEPTGRLLFRAPGLGWDKMKAINLNANPQSKKYIGPIHANIGTDAPRADWSCWKKGVTAETCANWYFHDIVNVGRGIILSHDIFYKPGRGNTYQMLKILLSRLDKEAGGINNKSGNGYWKFVTLEKNKALDKFDLSKTAGVANDSATSPTHPSDSSPLDDELPSGASTKPDPMDSNVGRQGAPLVIKNTSVLVRSIKLESENAISDNSRILINNKPAISGVVLELNDLNKTLDLGTAQFKLVYIVKTIPEFKALEGSIAYISTKAF